jgi:hypothetical protein
MNKAYRKYNTDDDGRGIGSHPKRHAVMAALWLLSFSLHAKVALTQTASDPMEVCFRVSDAAARLACFDSEMRRRHAAATPAPAVVAAPAPAPAASPPAISQVPAFAAAPAPAPAIAAAPAPAIAPAPPSTAASLTPAPKPLVVALARLIPHPGHIYVFELENGQAWESTESVSDLFMGAHELVTIRPGVMGAFFLKTQEGISIRIHRLR